MSIDKKASIRPALSGISSNEAFFNRWVYMLSSAILIPSHWKLNLTCGHTQTPTSRTNAVYSSYLWCWLYMYIYVISTYNGVYQYFIKTEYSSCLIVKKLICSISLLFNLLSYIYVAGINKTWSGHIRKRKFLKNIDLTVYFIFRRSSRQNHRLLHVARRSKEKQLRPFVEWFRNSKSL